MATCPTTTRRRNRRGAGSAPTYKLAILDEYERLSDPGAKGALLRREGLYSSHIVEWRRARDVGRPIRARPQAPQEALRRRAGDRASSAQEERAPRGPARPDTARRWRPREKHRSSWRSCWPRATPETSQQPEGAEAVIDECFCRDRAAARHQDRLCGRRAAPGPPTTGGPRPGG